MSDIKEQKQRVLNWAVEVGGRGNASREVKGNHLLLKKEVACTNQPLGLIELKK